MDRILDAVEDLLQGQPFAELSVQDVVDHADVSRSSFYARFPSKDDLLPAVYDRYVARMEAAAEQLLTDGTLSELSPEALINVVVRTYIDFARRFHPMLTSFDHGEIGAPYVVARDLVTGRVVQLYLTCVGREGDRRLERKVEFATRATASIILRAIAPPGGFGRAMQLSDDELADETAAMACAYLDVARLES